MAQPREVGAGLVERVRGGIDDPRPPPHHCEVVSINGNSYRLKNSLQAIERDTDIARAVVRITSYPVVHSEEYLDRP
ncbi:hypothetical protein SHL15_0885 [Streptomyces hygroscopicus subsp. limoneus]|nr:hypothetical protein SHL15_0885 [Streptomyces hygroscopicus subsp. limoneus]